MNRDLLLRYLLGEMSPEESAQIDERLLREETLANDFQDARFDLLDAYALDELQPAVRERVHRALVAEDGRYSDLVFSRVLQKRLAEPMRQDHASRTRFRWRWQFVLAAAGLIVAVALSAGLWRKPRNLSSQDSGAAKSVSDDHAARSESATQAVGQAFALLLSPQVLRGESSLRRITIPRDVNSIKMQIVVTDSTKRYSVHVETESGQTVVARNDLLPQHLGGMSFVEFSMNRSELTPRRYLVRLFLSDRERLRQENTYQVQVLSPAAPGSTGNDRR